MDDMLIWIVLLFIAWMAEGIASARRKRKRQAQGGSAPTRPGERARRAPRPRAPESARAGQPEPRRPTQPRPVEQPPVVVVPSDLVILREAPVEAAPPEGLWAEGVARAPTPLEGATLETEPTVASLETLEPAGGASHVAFHEKYLDQPPPPPRVRRRLRLGRGEVRRGIILAEILGPPKSER